jgi:RimJ/RimL family protein N-acetyltransferase
LLQPCYGYLSLFSLLHSLFSWAAQAEPTWPLHLLVFERNVAARRFYERHGGERVETLTKLMPDGGTPRVARYLWRDPARLLAVAPADS